MRSWRHQIATRASAVHHFLRSRLNAAKLVGPRVAFTIILLYLAAAMLLDPGKDTLHIPSAALAVSLAMAGVAFSYARTFRDADNIRFEVRYAGERLVHGAVMFLFSSLLKYGSIDLPRHLELLARSLGAGPRQKELDIFYVLLSLISFVFFCVGLVGVWEGVGCLGGVVMHRTKRYRGPKHYGSSAKEYERYLDEVDPLGATSEASAERRSHNRPGRESTS